MRDCEAADFDIAGRACLHTLILLQHAIIGAIWHLPGKMLAASQSLDHNAQLAVKAAGCSCQPTIQRETAAH